MGFFKYFLTLGGIVLFIVIILFLYIYSRLHRRVYIHVPSDTSLISQYNLKLKPYTFTSADGYKLSGWYVQHPNPKAVVIIVHGYSLPTGGKGKTVGYADFLYKAGYSSFLLDLRSFGESEGDKITFGINEGKDAEAAYDLVKSFPENSKNKVGFLGVSMGGTTVLIQTGKTGKGDFVISSVPFASINKLFEYQLQLENLYRPVFYPMLKLSAVIALGLNYNKTSAESIVKNITVPKLIIAAKDDESNNPQDAEYLFKIAKQPKTFRIINTKHDIFKYEPEAFIKTVVTFLDSIK